MRAYCQLCGSKYKEGLQQPWICTGCGHEYFENPIVTADVILFNDKRQLLIAKRSRDPYKGQYDFPGGFVEIGESISESVVREIQEELGLLPTEISDLTYVADHAVSYQFGGELKNLVPTVFTARLLTNRELTPGDDVESVKLIALDELDSVEFSRADYPGFAKKAYTLLFEQ